MKQLKPLKQHWLENKTIGDGLLTLSWLRQKGYQVGPARDDNGNIDKHAPGDKVGIYREYE